jgi:hypothetical protein
MRPISPRGNFENTHIFGTVQGEEVSSSAEVYSYC